MVFSSQGCGEDFVYLKCLEHCLAARPPSRDETVSGEGRVRNVCHRRETEASEGEAETRGGWLWGGEEGLHAHTDQNPTERALWALRTGVPKPGLGNPQGAPGTR